MENCMRAMPKEKQNCWGERPNQSLFGQDVAGDAASGWRADGVDRVSPARRTNRHAATKIMKDVGNGDTGAGLLLVFQRPLLFCAVEHSQIVDTNLFGRQIEAVTLLHRL